MSQESANKPFVSRLAWNDLDSNERTAAMDLIRSIDELKVKVQKEEGEVVNLESLIRAVRETVIEAGNIGVAFAEDEPTEYED